MQLGDWRYGGCKPWTTPEIARLRELVDAGMGPPANWRSEKAPGRSESTIRNQVTKPGMWGTLQPRFDGGWRELSVRVLPMLYGRLRQQAAARGLSLSELVRRACEQTLWESP